MSVAALRTRADLQPLDALFEAPGLPGFDLPDELAAIYDGTVGFPEQRLYANFVGSVDGVVALPALLDSSHLIAAGSEHDRFVMGLLRACADAVLIGAGTLHGSPQTRWTAEHAYPPAAPLYAELRRQRGLPPQPTLAVLSGSGRINPQHPGLGERSIVLTSEQGAAQLGRRLPDSAAIVPIGNQSPLDPALAVETLRAGGHELILCEGGAAALRRARRRRSGRRALPDALTSPCRPRRRQRAALAARGRGAAARPDARGDFADVAARRLAPLPALPAWIDFYPRRIRVAMEVTHVR